jgi:peptidoglycan hydrolase-like protein with peptidoglycan-binding domain
MFGALTANALGAFQRSAGLEATRVADEATVSALAQRAGNGGAGSPAPASPLLGLEIGARSDAVKQLQQALINAGVSVKGGADGAFGSNTQAALKQYQQALGLNASGVVDDATVNALAQGRTVSAGPSGLVGLKSGALGASVKSLQEALIKAGVSVRGGADGIFGPATAQALKSFQQSQGINPSGVVDDATLAALQNPKPPASPTSSSEGGYAVFGERGSRVLQLQAALVNAGIAVRGGVDGDFGAGTAAAVMDFQRAHGLSMTGKVNDATASALGLEKAAAPPPPPAGNVSFSVFPVQGFCQFGDTFGYGRGGGRAHLGIDILADAGKMIYAVADGTITKIYADYPGSLAGNGVQLTTADGTYYFYAHMTGINTGIAVGVKVKAGQIIGTVGKTGNTNTNHLHFEVHPKGGSAVNAYPYLKSIDACRVTDVLPQ